MSEFVDECRREWRRLGVPDPIANEMAADLMADLGEAEAEGSSAEDVLGNSAFDPRRFAAAWATARGVTNPPSSDGRSRWRSPLPLAVTAIMGVLVIGVGLVLVSGRSARSIALAPFVFRGHERFQAAFPPSGPQIIRLQSGGPAFPLALMVLIIGVVVLGVAAVYWFPWSRFSRIRSRQEPPKPGWS